MADAQATPVRFLTDGLSGRYSGPEVLFGEVFRCRFRFVREVRRLAWDNGHRVVVRTGACRCHFSYTAQRLLH